MKKIIILVLLALVITGCVKEAQDNTTGLKEQALDEKQTMIANPASEFCIKNGGTSDIIFAKDGSQRGLCNLPAGYVCDEWKYFRGECPCTDDATIMNCPVYSSPPPTFCKDGIILPGEYDECGCEGPLRCERMEDYTIAEMTKDTCEGPFECKTPMDYLVRSSCPYTSMCINNTCAVICPAPFNIIR
jgi:putative hemolysin